MLCVWHTAPGNREREHAADPSGQGSTLREGGCSPPGAVRARGAFQASTVPLVPLPRRVGAGDTPRGGEGGLGPGLLGARLVGVTDWLKKQAKTRDLSVGYFGASTGAAAALVAAATRKDVARAVVSRGGRPDLAGPYLARVEAPTLLIVGGLDRDGIG